MGTNKHIKKIEACFKRADASLETLKKVQLYIKEWCLFSRNDMDNIFFVSYYDELLHFNKMADRLLKAASSSLEVSLAADSIIGKKKSSNDSLRRFDAEIMNLLIIANTLQDKKNNFLIDIIKKR